MMWTVYALRGFDGSGWHRYRLCVENAMIIKSAAFAAIQSRVAVSIKPDDGYQEIDENGVVLCVITGSEFSAQREKLQRRIHE